jgi:peptide/nickel transport system substrate-binding protein
MKRTVCPFRAGHRACQGLLAILLFGFALHRSAGASRRPGYGGTLRVQMTERVSSIDPRRWPTDSLRASAAERVESLVFDRLVRFDDQGVPQPALAISWQHDAASKRWQFRLREGVKFTDGSLLTPEAAALALQQLLGNEFDVSANSDSVIIQADRSLTGLLAQLAAGRYFIFHTTTDGGIFGTGPLQVGNWPTDATLKVVLTANEFCWAGRPFVDKIELTMGLDPQQEANAIAFGQADVVELPASEVRRASQRGVRAASSDPVELFALVFDPARSAVQDVRVRQAISLAIDRTSIAEVILQRQGVAAGSLLPNWISGYAHLFRVSMDLSRAKELLSDSGHQFSRPTALALVYDFGDADARSVAERVAVNLREVGVMVQVSGQSVGAKNLPADLRLVRRHIASPDPGAALLELLNSVGETATDMETIEQVYAAERGPIDAFRVIPLAHVSESYGVGPHVRDWTPRRWGGWRLEDVWLGPPAAAGGTSP